MDAVLLLCAAAVASPCVYVNTSGQFGDKWNTGNDDTSTYPTSVAPLWTLEAAPVGSGSGDGSDGTSFGSHVKRADEAKKSLLCYYTTRQFCVQGSALLFFNTGDGDKGGKLRLCNDLRPRIKLPYASVDAAGPPAGAVTRDVGHVVACWQLYGYHLFLCLLSAWYTQQLHGLPKAEMWAYNHADTLDKQSREHFSMASFFGSPTSWDDPHHPEARAKGYADSAFWRLWSTVSIGPGAVRPLARYAARPRAAETTVCYRRGLVGMVSPLAIGPQAKRLFVRAVLGEFGLLHTPPGCGQGEQPQKMLVLVRRGGARAQGTRTLSNAPAVARAGREAGLDATEASFEDVPLVEQVRLSAEADVFVSSHGGGNTWLAMMRERSIFVECWLDYPRRLVYVDLAKQRNIRYYPVSQGVPGAAYLTQSVEVPIPQLRRILTDALAYLGATRCCGG